MALVLAAREAPILTLIESRLPPVLMAASGDRIPSAGGDRGTLGGFLEDGVSGKTYGVTCGHVISAGPVSSAHGPLGPCVASAPPQPLPSGVNCCTGCPHMTDHDLALIETVGGEVNSATTIAHYVGNGQLVDMDGATSGTVRYEVGSAVVEQLIDGCCWTRLYQIHAPVGVGYLPVSMGVATTPLPKGGDSGAWLRRNVTEWAGMVVAADTLHGYALPATMVHAGAQALLNASLVLA